MSSAASSKPKVLLSIVEYEGFDHVDDIETLNTGVSIGHGYYECERLLKKGFIELMNLPPLPIIGLYVCQRDQSGKKQARYLAIVPLGAIHPAFLNGECVTSASNEPATWKKWLGLFGAKVPLKDQSPEQIFEKCLMMGASEGQHPKLLIQLQFLEAGSATSPLTPRPALATINETDGFVDIISRLYVLRGMSPPRNLYRASMEELVQLFEAVVGLMEAAAASHTSSVGLPSSSSALIVDEAASLPCVAPRGPCVSPPSSGLALGSGCSTPLGSHPSCASPANSTQSVKSRCASPSKMEMELSISSTVSTQCSSAVSLGSPPSCASPANSTQSVKSRCAGPSEMDMESSWSLWQQQAKATLDQIGAAREPEIEDDIAAF